MTERGNGQQATLVADIGKFLAGWQQLLRKDGPLEAGVLAAQQQQAERLHAAALRDGASGLAHHLSQCCRQLKTLPLDERALRESLRALSEIAWQLKQELRSTSPNQSGNERAQGRSELPAAGLEPPPLLMGGSERERACDKKGPAPSIAAPPLLSWSGAGQQPAARDRASLVVVPAPSAMARSLALDPPPALSAGLASAVSPPFASAALLGAAPGAASPARLPEPALRPPAPSAAPPERGTPIGAGQAASAAAPDAVRAAGSSVPARGPSGAPGLLSTVFGLRAFGRHAARKAAAEPPAHALVAAAQGVNLLGLRSRAPKEQLSPPALLSGPGGLPALPGEPGGDVGASADLDVRLRRLRSRDSKPGSSRRRDAGRPGKRPHLSGAGSGRHPAFDPWQVPWWAGPAVVLVLGMVVGAALWVRQQRARPLRDGARPAVVASAPETTAVALAAAPPTTPPDQHRFQQLMVQIHDFGGQESPELAALLNAEAAATYQALAHPCDNSAGAHCENQRQARELLIERPVVRRQRRSAGAPRWMAGLKIPAVGAQDHPDVQRWLEYYTGHPVGRELFQTMLFRCGAYQDLIHKTLVHYGMPQDLMAVVLTESACVPNAESPVGAKGLWQFMAPTARAYHLYVQEGVVDERVSPVKATEAAVRFLADLYRKMGSWDIALASYNAGTGPFRMLARMRLAGGDATFWDLAEAGLVPEETAKYVPRIQAYALILANLRHFDFATAQVRTAEETADLEVPSRTRLGQVARAAGTSVAYLRSLNPDLVGTVVPSLPDNRFVLQVPKAAVFRARETLEQFLQEELDLCVPSAFDWGRERFTAEMEAKCARGAQRAH